MSILKNNVWLLRAWIFGIWALLLFQKNLGGVSTIQKCFLDGNIKCHLFQSSSCVENIRKMKLVLDLKLINFNDSFKENPYKQYEYKKFFQES